MKHLGIEVQVKNKPVLDQEFLPIYQFNQAFLKTAKQAFCFAVERNGGQVARYETFIHGTQDMKEADLYYLERLIKSILWLKGGFRVYIQNQPELATQVRRIFSVEGSRAFDSCFMADVFEHEFEVVDCSVLPEEKSNAQAMGRHLDGCRIGFDAGGSDRKVSAVIDGEAVYSEEVLWYPKVTADPEYHYQEILKAMREAAAKMPRVDAIGVSSAGIYIDNRTMKASLFLEVPEADFEAKVKDIYIRAAREFGDVPLVVANDGDVTALAGSMSLGENNILGIAMGTSEAVGFVDADGNINGWLNELAFMPVDANPKAMMDEWSGDIGVGCKYFSQDAVIKLALAAGMKLDETLPPAKKLKLVQELMEKDDQIAHDIYLSIGTYLGHSLAYYHTFYQFKYVLLLGRVMSGKGGDLILAEATRVLHDEYPTVAEQITLTLPDEKFRRVGQSVAAASLPKLG